MKAKKNIGKLTLNKTIISTLNQTQQEIVNGGGIPTWFPYCPHTQDGPGCPPSPTIGCPKRTELPCAV